MNAISDACGLRTDAHGIILSLPVDEVIGLETARTCCNIPNKKRKCRRQPPAALFFFYSLQALHFRIPRTSAMTAP